MPPPRSKSAKKASPLDLAKTEAAAKQQEIEDLTQEVRRLREELDRKIAEVERLSKKLHIILPEILSHRDQEKFPLEPLDSIIGMFSSFLYSHRCVYLLLHAHVGLLLLFGTTRLIHALWQQFLALAHVHQGESQPIWYTSRVVGCIGRSSIY